MSQGKLWKGLPAREFCLDFISNAGWNGITSKEILAEVVPDEPLFHHGAISGPCSILHGNRVVAMLAEEREGFGIYVLPEHVDDRPTQPHVSWGKITKEEIARLQANDAWMKRWMEVDHTGARFATDRTKAERNHRLFFGEARRRYGVDG